MKSKSLNEISDQLFRIWKVYSKLKTQSSYDRFILACKIQIIYIDNIEDTDDYKSMYEEMIAAEGKGIVANPTKETRAWLMKSEELYYKLISKKYPETIYRKTIKED